MSSNRTSAQLSALANGRNSRHGRRTLGSATEAHATSAAVSSTSTVTHPLLETSNRQQPYSRARRTRGSSALEDAHVYSQQLLDELNACQQKLAHAYTHSAQLEQDQAKLSDQLSLAQTKNQRLSDVLHDSDRKLQAKRKDHRTLSRANLRLRDKAQSLQASLETLDLRTTATVADNQKLSAQVSHTWSWFFWVVSKVFESRSPIYLQLFALLKNLKPSSLWNSRRHAWKSIYFALSPLARTSFVFRTHFQHRPLT